MIIPLCKNCQHYSKSSIGVNYDKCLFNPEKEPIRGELISKYCDIERASSYDDKCGKSAVNFLPRKGK